MSDFPKRLYGRFAEAATPNEFLETTNSVNEALDAIPLGEETVIAEYELVAVKRYKANVVECADDTTAMGVLSK